MITLIGKLGLIILAWQLLIPLSFFFGWIIGKISPDKIARCACGEEYVPRFFKRIAPWIVKDSIPESWPVVIYLYEISPLILIIVVNCIIWRRVHLKRCLPHIVSAV